MANKKLRKGENIFTFANGFRAVLNLVGRIELTENKRKYCVLEISDEVLEMTGTEYQLTSNEECRWSGDCGKWICTTERGGAFHEAILAALKEVAKAKRERVMNIRKQAEQAHALRRLAQGEWLATSYLRWLFEELATTWIAYRNKFCAFLKRGVAKFVNKFEQLFGMFSANNTIGDFVK